MNDSQTTLQKLKDRMAAFVRECDGEQLHVLKKLLITNITSAKKPLTKCVAILTSIPTI